MKNQVLREIGKNSLASLAGVLLTLGCAPFNIFPFGLLSCALLLALWLNVSRGKAFVRGFYYGLGLFGSGLYWVYISMHNIGDLPPLVAGGLTALFIAIMALFPAYQGWLLNRYFPNTNSSKILCAFPATWVLLEWARSWLFTGFPWLYIGYTQLNSPLRGYAPLISVYGVSLLTVLSGALLVNAYRLFKKKKQKLGYLNLFLLMAIWTAGGVLNTVTWTHPAGEPLQVSLVQGNIPQKIKWEPEQVEPTLQEYKDLSSKHWDSQLIVWPEAAVPAALNDVPEFINEMGYIARSHHATLITGIPVKNFENNRYFNAVISVGSTPNGYYLKHNLVPFGEYVPFEKWLGKFFDLLQVPMSEMTPAKGIPEPIELQHGLRLLTFICSEIAYPEILRYPYKEIGLILTVSNDAWFGHSIAQAQHLQMAQMRALEIGRPLLFASNNGLTAMISPKGKLLAEAPPFETYVLTDKIQPYAGKTPWHRYGMDPVLVILVSLFYLAFKHRRRV